MIYIRRSIINISKDLSNLFESKLITALKCKRKLGKKISGNNIQQQKEEKNILETKGKCYFCYSRDNTFFTINEVNFNKFAKFTLIEIV